MDQLTLPLSSDQIGQHLLKLKTEWQVIDNKKLFKNYKFKDFNESVEFVNKVAQLADQQNHHPDIHIYYNRVGIEIWTHSINGLQQNDFILAGKIEKIV